ncbi:tagatose-bisphosphate aldolase [Enterococcus faecium]|uniref:tagatose-bisphosphate aldolase n=1 Tax=Enterococcus faecium TaxID=1352 RepID=UPI000A35294B|nr:tagatose-bisphosphate aldolase [Enterococcus faecium]OTO45293.1 tagatose 1,6-diphosphate aldolase [Enterococcus faecium]
MNEEKRRFINRLCSSEGIIGALAIDQRGALKKMIAQFKGSEAEDTEIVEFKKIVASELTEYASSILLDPDYGLPAADVKNENSGLLLAYEKTGYDTSTPGRLPDLLASWAVKRLKEAGADACKTLLYYDIDESEEINHQKHAFIERIGLECQAEKLPFFLELLSYDATIPDSTSKKYAREKPHKVIEMMKEFSKTRYGVDALKVEVPVNMKYVEGYGIDEAIYTKSEAAAFFKEQAESTPLPYVFLSAGVTSGLFQETLHFAKHAGSTFNGVLCGRATWADGIKHYVLDGKEAAIEWMNTQGRANIESLNTVLKETATPIDFNRF